jgi:hypothetical protein
MADPHGVESRLRLARQVLSPSDEHRLRVRSALAARLAAEGPASPLAHGARVARRVASPRISRAVEAVVLVAAGFALGYWFADARQPGFAEPGLSSLAADRGRMDREGATLATAALREQGRPAAERAELLPTPAEPTRRLEAQPATPRAQGSSAAPSATHRAHPRAVPRATAADGFAEELALLRRAERATRSGDAALARSLIAELDARFPKTALRQERAALLVLVACLTSEPAAQADARDFMRRHEQSLYIDRIRAACGLDAMSGAGLQVPGVGPSAK